MTATIPMILSDDVKKARADGTALVALESTLISHGLPHPENITVARAAEDAVRQHGSTPATIAVMEGKAHIGLDDDGMKTLATTEGVAKLSRRDLPVAFSSSGHRLGATTVSATMILAHHVGIDIFATGGIGGVHRGVEATMDISADLFELAETPVAVVCAGPKAILDLPRTREHLETMGVTLVGYQCDDMPAFWSRSSGLPVDIRVETAEEIADIINTRKALNIGGAVLICNPIPEAMAIDLDVIEGWIAACLDDAPQGAAATPWLLAEIALQSKGQSLEANKHLIINNAGLAGQIARHLQ